MEKAQKVNRIKRMNKIKKRQLQIPKKYHSTQCHHPRLIKDHRLTLFLPAAIPCMIKRKSSKNPKRKTKKKKKETSISIVQTQLEPAKTFIEENSTNFPLTFDLLSEFLYMTYDNKNILEASRTYTQDTEAIINMLNEVIPQLTEQKIRSRIGRIITKLRNKSFQEEPLRMLESPTDMSCSEESNYAEE